MSGPTRPPSGGASRQPWTPDQAPKGVTCPACGLANEPGARVCRNCGLPIASDSDPLRGVAPGHVDLPKTHRSSLSATIGLVLVLALLLVGGSLAVSGGGILSSGGRLIGSSETPTPGPAATVDPETGEVVVPVASGEPGTEESELAKGASTSFEYTCDDDAIKDLSRGKWFLSEVVAGPRDTYDQIFWRLSRETKKNAANAATVTMEWTTPKEAQEKYGIARVLGNNALVISFNGPVDITRGYTIDTNLLEGEGIEQIKKVQLFEDNGKVRTVIGLKGDSCAAMRAVGWAKGKDKKNATVYLDIERF